MSLDESNGQGVASPSVKAVRTDQPTRIAVIADVHLATEATGTWKCYHQTETFLERAVKDIQSRDPDAVVVAGDLTKDGESYNFDRFDELVGPLEPTVTIPGNHDVPKSYVDHTVPTIEQFEARYTADGYPFCERAGGVDLLCLNSATVPDGSLQDTWGGRISQTQLDWLGQKLQETTTSIVVLHHNLFAQPEHDSEFGANFQLNNSEALLGLLSEHAPVLVVSGHHHIPSLDSVNGVTEVIAPALCSYPASYLVVDIGPQGIEIDRIPVATPAEKSEAYTLGTTGSDLGKRVIELAETRLRDGPYK